MTILGLFIVSACRLTAQDKIATTGTEPGFAVLELYTSEGCSSCPPAEALLEQIDKASADKPIYALAFHVDYFDRLGWKDVFGDPAYTKRQYAYSRFFQGQVYTPQLVVNGTVAGVGSNPEFVQSSLNNALNTAAAATIQSNLKLASGSAILNYKADGEIDHTKLVVAIVQKHAISKVTRGENEGRTLSHAAIVRGLQEFKLSETGSGNTKIKLPAEFNQNHWDIITFLQNPRTGRIVAASRAHI